MNNWLGVLQKEDVSKAEEERLNLMNLQLMMKKMEEWAHRMFPKSRFDDTLEKIEHLGNKRPVKVSIQASSPPFAIFTLNAGYR